MWLVKLPALERMDNTFAALSNQTSTARPDSSERADNSAASRIAATMLECSANPLPAMSNAVP
jgi:hypothetical protein